MDTSQSNDNGGDVLVSAVSKLTLPGDESSIEAPDSQSVPLPSHLSHDPQNNMKRSDPFQFGSRLLSEKDNVFEFNAWDHVETDDIYKEYAEEQFAKQREAPVSDFDKSKHNTTSFPLVSSVAPPLHPDDLITHSSSEACGL